MRVAAHDGDRRGPRHLFRSLSLRARLVLGLLLIAVVGLGAADAIVYEQIHSYLVSQLDTQLESNEAAMQNVLIVGRPVAPGVPIGTFGLLINSQGSAVNGECVSNSGACGGLPAVPKSLLAQLSKGPANGIFFASAGGGQSYQVLARSISPPYIDPVFGEIEAFAIAMPLSGTNSTLGRLILVDLGVSASVLALLVALGYAVVRVGLRPLVEIEETAGAIARGDLSQRVEREDDRTELGRLGGALNAMLATIETSFSEQKTAEQQLRQFLADASHELRTPLTSIRGYAELFRRGAATRPEDLARAMRRIEDESVRMGVLVDDLLLLARLDQGRPLEHEQLDLACVAIDVAADAQLLAPDRLITVLAPEPVIVDGDEIRLRQVASNLIQNALRHTPRDTTVTVTVKASGSSARLAVADDGPGIDAEHAAHVFERFYRADPSRARESGGAGLGLAIVASIAEAHGGRAWVETTKGQGSTFLVEIPRARPAPPTPQPPETAAALPTPNSELAREVHEEVAR